MAQANVQALLIENEDDGYPTRPTMKQRMRKTAVRVSRGTLGTMLYTAVSLWGGYRVLSRLGKQFMPLRPAQFQPRRILVIRLDLIGDMVLSMVLVRVLKRTYPDTEIDVISVPASARVIEGDPTITQLFGYDPNIWRRPRALLQKKNWRELHALLKTLHERDYDLAISVFGKWAAVLAALSSAKRVLGFGREGFPGLLTDNVPGKHWEAGKNKHEVDYCLALAQAAGATIHEEDRLAHLSISSESELAVEQLLAQSGIQAGRAIIVCHVSANNGQSKRWPIPYWAVLLDLLIREENAYVVLTGASDDLPLIDKIIARMSERPLNLAGKTSLTQLAALLKRANLLISGDSGPMHIAGAVDTPLIAIHGPTDPALSGPVSRHATILRSTIWCSPCYTAKETADCRFFTTQCMKDILPMQVFTLAREKLRQP